MPNFSGSLNQNKITTVLYNMIISQKVFDSKVASTELADRFRVDGTLFGDTKLYHSFDIGSPEDWLNDAEAADLLKLSRNKSGKTQAIVMNVFKIISITIDHYLSKQAFMRDGSFAEYTAFLTGSLRKIKKVYDRSLINSKLGTLTPATAACSVAIVTPNGSTQEEENRLEAQTIAQEFEILRANLEDNSRDFNYYGYLRSYSADDMIAVWNVKFRSRLTKVDVPTIFHKDIGENGNFREYVLPEKWFGTAGTASQSVTIANAGDIRIKESGWYNVVPSVGTEITLVAKPDTPTGNPLTSKTVFLWAGDKVPTASTVYTDNVRGCTITTTATTIDGGLIYTVDPTCACVLVHKDALPYMSGFETGTEFWNSRSVTTNHYLIFGHNTLEFLEEYPRIKVTVTKSEDAAKAVPVMVMNDADDNPVPVEEVTQ